MPEQFNITIHRYHPKKKTHQIAIHNILGPKIFQYNVIQMCLGISSTKHHGVCFQIRKYRVEL